MYQAIDKSQRRMLTLRSWVKMLFNKVQILLKQETIDSLKHMLKIGIEKCAVKLIIKSKSIKEKVSFQILIIFTIIQDNKIKWNNKISINNHYLIIKTINNLETLGQCHLNKRQEAYFQKIKKKLKKNLKKKLKFQKIMKMVMFQTVKVNLRK